MDKPPEIKTTEWKAKRKCCYYSKYYHIISNMSRYRIINEEWQSITLLLSYIKKPLSHSHVNKKNIYINEISENE
jgi:hypothetical protein